MVEDILAVSLLVVEDVLGVEEKLMSKVAVGVTAVVEVVDESVGVIWLLVVLGVGPEVTIQKKGKKKNKQCTG